ncbi:hypothetical protein C8J57DRAFT_1483545 [Mycena rebaudengoi]|nr:hypothetical protein C8J57DRAFT_1483545 [Mycena rebaudengoi]
MKSLKGPQNCSSIAIFRHQLSTPWVCVTLLLSRVAPLHKVRGLYERAAADGINKCEFHLDFIAPLHKLRHHRRISISRSRNMSGRASSVLPRMGSPKPNFRESEFKIELLAVSPQLKLPTHVWTIRYTPPIDAAGPTQAAPATDVRYHQN